MNRKSHGIESHYWEDDGHTLKLGNTFEDGGWYIEVEYNTTNPIRLYEIPLYGGKAELIGEYSTLGGAMYKAKHLT